MNLKLSREMSFLLQILSSKATSAKIEFHDIDNQKLLNVLNKHRILSKAFIAKINNKAPHVVLNQINNQNKIKTLNNLSMLGELIRVTKLLNHHNIMYVCLKGIPLSMTLLGDPLIRHSKDIDIWIEENKLDEVIKILQEIGYHITYPDYELKGFKKDYFLKHKYDIALYNNRRNVEIELQFKLSPLAYNFSFFNINDVPTELIKISGHEIVILEHNYHFLYLIQHGSKHAWFRLKWLYDIYLYLQTGLIDINKVFELAKTFGEEVVLLQTFLLLRNLFNFENEDIKNIVNKTKVDKKVVRLTQLSLKIITSNDHVSILNNPISKNALRFRLYLLYLSRNYASFSGVKYFFDAFFQINILFKYFTLSKRFAFIYYIIYPLEVLRIMINNVIGKIKNATMLMFKGNK